MVRTADRYLDEESDSSASFEEVGRRRPSKKLVKVVVSAGNEAIKDGEVPDVVYVVQYRGIGGRIMDVRKSDKPLDIDVDSFEDEVSGSKKPVLEIITSVSATVQRPSRRRPPPPPRRYDPYAYNEYCSDGEAYYDDSQDGVRISKVEKTEMVIHSQHLRNAISAVVNYYPGVELMGDKVIVEAPYRVLVHHMKELELYKVNQPKTHDSETAAVTAKHIDTLCAFLNTTVGKQVEEEERRWANAVPTATFENFWLLMKPGELIYKKDDNHWTPYVVSRVVTGQRDGGKDDAYLLEMWNVQYVDGRMQRLMESFYIYPFNGEQPIHTLPICPARFFPEGAKAITEKQISLGKLYWELVKRPTYMDYDGLMVDDDGNNAGNLTGRVIVDAEGYDRFGENGLHRRSRSPIPRRRHPPPPNSVPPPKDQLPQFKPHCPCSACTKTQVQKELGPFAGFEDLNPDTDEAPKNSTYFEVMVDTIPAFLLSERRWGTLKLEHLEEVKVDRDAFKYLVLDDDIKLTVKSLIGKFASSDGKVSPWPNDFVKNKGEGRIFLLHGSPGVGKTCTAECVAELTHRPLLSLTSGDISTSMSASSVERNLSYFLQLGERYGALVLLDEADVYLEERRTRDLRRNGLVSIFLRALEYYRGVLFLTTNRVEAFDSAFTSRIHVALHYKRLTDADRTRIWTNNFERLERDSAGKCRVPHAAREFAFLSDEVQALRWNGREIRNALQTAVALAETDALEDGVETVTVSDKHLRAVVKMSKGFKDFLSKRRGWDEDDEDEDDEDADESQSSDSDL